MERTTYEIINQRLVQTVTQFNGQQVRYEHDLLERLVAKGPAPAPGQAFTPVVSFEYNPRGQRTQMQDPSGITTYDYEKPFHLDSHDHLVTKVTPQGTLSYDYDPQGNLLSLFAVETTTYQCDALNRLTNVAKVGQASSLSRYTYDPNGNLKSVG